MALSNLKANKGQLRKLIGSKFAGAYIRFENLYKVSKKKHDAPVAFIFECPGLAIATAGFLWEIVPDENGRAVTMLADEKKGVTRYPEYDMLAQAIERGAKDVFKAAEAVEIMKDERLHDGLCSTMVDGKAYIRLKAAGKGREVYLDFRIVKAVESIFTEVEQWSYERIEAGGGGDAARVFVLMRADDTLVAMAQPSLPGQKQLKLGYSDDGNGDEIPEDNNA